MIFRLLAILLLCGPSVGQNVVHYTTTNANVKYLFATAEAGFAFEVRRHSGHEYAGLLWQRAEEAGRYAEHGQGRQSAGGAVLCGGRGTGGHAGGEDPRLAGGWRYGRGRVLAGIRVDQFVALYADAGGIAPAGTCVVLSHRSRGQRGDLQAIDSDFSVKIPMHPFFGCIGVAPANGEARSSIVPAEFGGNMDSPEASVGNTVYFPVNVKGGLLYIGDGHAAMGDGEAAGSAIEVPLKARVQLSVIKGRTIEWPQFENDDAIMTVGAYRPLDDAARIALTELVHWIHKDYGLSELDAYELLSKVAKIHLNEMVDPNYVVVASMEKKYLPAKKKQ